MVNRIKDRKYLIKSITKDRDTIYINDVPAIYSRSIPTLEKIYRDILRAGDLGKEVNIIDIVAPYSLAEVILESGKRGIRA